MISTKTEEIKKDYGFSIKKSKSIEQKAWMSADFEYGLVSVIIPTYNRAAFLSKLFNNLYDLTYRPIEIIIVDDGFVES